MSFHLAPVIASYAPAVVAASGARASYRFLMNLHRADCESAHMRGVVAVSW